MRGNDEMTHNAHLRSIRSAIVGTALAMLTGALVLHDEPLAFPMLILTLIVVAYSFVPTLIHS